MKYYYLQRWLASKAKLEGKTSRESPSEHTWELVLVDDNSIKWYRLYDNVFKGSTFGNEIEVDKEQAKKFLESLKENNTVVIYPGQFLNDTKATRVFIRLHEKGRAKILEDEFVKRYLLKDKQVVLSPRTGISGQYRITVSSGPGGVDEFEMKLPKLQIIEDKNNPDVVMLKNVPIAKAGVWNGIQITKSILDGLRIRFEKLKDKLYVPLKLEHSGIKESEEQTPQGPALGWLVKIEMYGDTLLGDFIKVPKAVARLIKNGQYIGVSPEIARNFEGTPDVLVGVALLGAALPAMTTLPKLIDVLYAERKGLDVFSLEIPTSAFGGVMSEEIKGNVAEEQKTISGSPEIVKVLDKLLFQRESIEGEHANEEAALRLKLYPTVLAKEMLSLLPDVSMKSIDIIPEYTLEMVAKRVEVLADRAKQPEKCEDVISEIEETLEIFKDKLAEEENKELKARLESVLEEAKKNKGTTTLEEAKEKEKPAELPKEESYPSAPQPEKYPKVPENVTVELQKLESELKARALGLVKATVDKFQAHGWDRMRLSRLEELLTELDPVLTPKQDSDRVRVLLFQLLESAPKEVQTFTNFTTAQNEPDYVETILSATKRARAKR